MRTCSRSLLLLVVFVAGCARPASSESLGNPDVAAGSVGDDAKTAANADKEDVPITEADVAMPADYQEAVRRLGAFRDAIREAVASGRLGKAHRPLDETDIVLNRLPEIARASGVPRRDWERVVVAGEDLGESLAEIHTDIDAGRSPDYAARAEAIDDALARLAALGHAADKHDDNSTEGK